MIGLNATQTYYDKAENSVNVLIYGWSNVNFLEPLNGSVYSAGQNVQIVCEVRNNLGQTLSNYPVEIWKNDELLDVKLTDSDGKVSYTWYTTTEPAGYYNLSCRIKDNSTLYYNTSKSIDSSIIKLSRPLVIDQIILQPASIYRNDSFDPHTTNILVHVKDAQIGNAENANVSFYNSTHYLYSCLTNSTGYCEFPNFNVSDDYIPGIYKIFVNATKEGNEDSETEEADLIVKGILFAKIVLPVNGSAYAKSESIPLKVNVTSENGENVSYLNPRAEWYNETALIAVGLDTSLPQPEVAKQRTGYHDFMVKVIKSYYDTGIDNVTIQINGLADVEWISPSGTLPYPDVFYPTCRVIDHDAQSGISNYLVNISYKWFDESEFTLNASLMTNETGYVSYEFKPWKKGNVTFKCEIGDNTTQFYSANVKEVTQQIWIKDTRAPWIENVSILPNTSIEANLNSTKIKATVLDNYGIYQVWAEIILPDNSTLTLPMQNITPLTKENEMVKGIYEVEYVPPLDGIYEVYVHAKDKGPEFNENVTYAGSFDVWGKTAGFVYQCVNHTQDENANDCDLEIIAFGITQYDSFTFEINATFKNLGPATAYSVNLTHVEQPSGSLIYNESKKECGTVYAGQTCNWVFKVTVPAKTPPQDILTKVKATWKNPDLTIDSIENLTLITVASNPVVNIKEEELISEIPHDKKTLVGNITTASEGNDDLYEVGLAWYGISNVLGYKNLAIDCPGCEVTIVPNSLGTLPAGTKVISNIYVKVPPGQEPGKYLAKVYAFTANAGNDSVLLNLTVPINTSWIREPASFGTFLTPPNTSGLIGIINVTNVGNVKIKFTASKTDMGSYTKIEGMNTYPFELEKQTTKSLTVTYSIPADATEGIYNVTIFIRNSSAVPKEQTVTFTLNVTDIPPKIENVSVYPTMLEVNESVIAQARITDNFAVDKAWINVSLPNNQTLIQLMNKYDSFYNTTFNVSLPGKYVVRICANDTRSLISCVERNVYAFETTELEIIPNVTYVVADNVTIYYNQTIPLNITLNNTKGARAFDVNLSVISYSNLTAQPNFVELGTIQKLSSKSVLLELIIPANTSIGKYNLTLNVTWRNLNSTLDFTLKNLTVEVIENPLLVSLQPNLTAYIEAGTEKNLTVSLQSIGNVNVTNVTFNCSEGEVCTNFTVQFIPSNLSLVEIGETVKVNVSVDIPPNYEAGKHSGIIKVSYDSKHLDIPIYIYVPVNISWEQTPTQIVKYAYPNQTGIFGTIKLINTGNSPIDLNLSINGSIAPYLTLNQTFLVLGYGESKAIQINYTSPFTIADLDLEGYVKSKIVGELAENSSIKERATYAKLSVLAYFVKIVEPTYEKPFTQIQPNDLVTLKVNVTSNAVPAGLNVNFEVKLFNETIETQAPINKTYFNTSDNLWYVTIVAPNLSVERAYSLNVTASYIAPRIRSSIEKDSIIYRDLNAPLIEIEIPPRIKARSTVNIKVNITEKAGLRNVSVWMKYPDNTTQKLNLTLVSKLNDIYLYELNFSNTSNLGVYEFSVSACDRSDNCAIQSKQFEIYPVAIFAGYVKDVESSAEEPIPTKFEFYDANRTNLIISLETNEEGYYNETIDVRTYDLVITTLNSTFQNRITFDDLAISNDYFNPIIIGRIPRVRATTTMLKGIYVDTIFNHSAVLEISFADCANLGCGVPIYDITKLGIYQYTGNWTPKLTTANNELWKRITNLAGDNSDNSINITSFVARVNLTNLKGAFILAEFICGNGECETDYGESTSNCPIDCPSLPPTPAPPAAPGAGAGVGPIPINITRPAPANVTPANVTIIPVEAESTLLETTLIQGEEKIFSVDIKNNLPEPITVNLKVEGPVFQLLTLDQTTLTIQPKTKDSVMIKASAPLSVAPGIYTGYIIVSFGDRSQRIPITVKIKALVEPLLDVKLKALTKVVAPGRNLTFEVTLINMGETASIEDITVTYNVRRLEDEKILLQSKETLGVKNVIRYRRTMLIPENFEEGRYIIEANATYWYGKKYAIASDNFDVSSTPVIFLVLKAVFTSWITYLVLLAGIPTSLFGLRWYYAYKAAKLAKARYRAPVDFKALPKPGPNSIKVGKIAETNVDAYLDISQFTMHSIAAGGTGSGKSVSAMICAEELLMRKIPVIVFDPTAQWTGFMKPCRFEDMLRRYPRFGLRRTDARGFKTNIIVVTDPEMKLDIKKYMKPGEITVFVMNRLKPEQLDKFVRRSIQAIFDMRPPESKRLKLLLVYDEVHRLLPKYGGKGGYVAIERAAREFRKWGIGLFLISQVLLDFKGAIRANIANEIQLRTKYEGDINRVKSKYGSEYASKVTKLEIGTGLFQNPEYNHGKPWFISFRPLLHSPFALTDKEIDTYLKLTKEIEELEAKIKELKRKKVDTYDLEIELNIAKDKIKTAAFRMAETYVESLKKRIEKVRK